MQRPAPLYSSGEGEETPLRRLSLCNDLVFKVLFSAHLHLLTDLVNAVRHPEPPLTVKRILNPSILPEDLASKSIVLDILAEDEDGQRLGIEMQLQRFLHWPQRNIYGVTRTLAGQLQSGQDYRQLKPAIGISLLVHDLFEAHPDHACWRFTLRDDARPAVQLGQALQVHIIELRKAERQRALPAPLQAWIACLLHNLDEAAMNTISHPPVKEALKQLEALYSNDELRLAAERREQALIDAEDAADYARLEGREKGRKEGREEGRKEGLEEGLQQQRQTLSYLLERKFGHVPSHYQARLSQADGKQVQTWSLKVLEAQHLDEVFAAL